MTTTRRDTPSFGTRGFIFALVLAFIFYLLVSAQNSAIVHTVWQSSGRFILDPLQVTTRNIRSSRWSRNDPHCPPGTCHHGAGMEGPGVAVASIGFGKSQ
jgi:hypothetical protein